MQCGYRFYSLNVSMIIDDISMKQQLNMHIRTVSQTLMNTVFVGYK